MAFYLRRLILFASAHELIGHLKKAGEGDLSRLKSTTNRCDQASSGTRKADAARAKTTLH